MEKEANFRNASEENEHGKLVVYLEKTENKDDEIFQQKRKNSF
jgi:hypothetical protein